jgi:hypothetical protein
MTSSIASRMSSCVVGRERVRRATPRRRQHDGSGRRVDVLDLVAIVFAAAVEVDVRRRAGATIAASFATVRAEIPVDDAASVDAGHDLSDRNGIAW